MQKTRLAFLAVTLSTTIAFAQNAPERLGLTVQTVPGGIHASLRVEERLIAAVQAMFQQKVTIVNMGAISEMRPITELALAERKVRELVHVHSAAMMQEKRIIATQVFTVKLGYKLDKGITVRRDTKDGSISILVPEPEILSIAADPIDYVFVADGVTHKNSVEDYKVVEKTLRENATNDTVLIQGIEQTARAMATRLIDVLAGIGVKATVASVGDKQQEDKPPVDKL